MLKLDLLLRLRAAGIVAIVRAATPQAAMDLAQACIAGGVTALEVALTTPSGLEVIRQLVAEHGERVLIGAGTVLDPETARAAMLAGARFIISPGVNVETIRMCNRYQVVCMPGAMTPTEILTALEAGADVVKLFPADGFDAGYLKALRAPLPQVAFMPTGGVTLENLAQWFAAGSVAVGVGSSMTGAASRGDYAAVTETARGFVERLAQVRAAQCSNNLK